jgi:hypothetical protein
MTFIAHLKYHNVLDEYKLKRDCILFTARNFTNAMSIIEDCYGDDLYSITLLEPISDSDLVYINEKVEEIIRGFEENGF